MALADRQANRRFLTLLDILVAASTASKLVQCLCSVHHSVGKHHSDTWNLEPDRVLQGSWTTGRDATGKLLVPGASAWSYLTGFRRVGKLTQFSFRSPAFRTAVTSAGFGLTGIPKNTIHLDHHHLWDPNEFAVSCFRIIMYSIQAQHSHHVIQQVLNHLDTHNKSTPRVRAGIVQVLLETVAIAAKGSV
ncbi:hypothetical protein ILYODFUR_022046, partial [Ilyodon furcidens]